MMLRRTDALSIGIYRLFFYSLFLFCCVVVCEEQCYGSKSNRPPDLGPVALGLPITSAERLVVNDYDNSLSKSDGWSTP